MSSSNNIQTPSTIEGSQPNKRRWFAAAGGLAGAGLIAAAVLVPTSGADWFDSGEGTVKVSVGAVSIDVNEGNSGAFNLAFEGLMPGVTKQQSFKVTNTGDVPVTLTFQADNFDVVGGAGLNATTVDQLTASLNGDPAKPVLQFGGSVVTLGGLESGQTATIPVTVSLAANADKAWSGVQASGDVVVKAVQR